VPAALASPGEQDALGHGVRQSTRIDSGRK
jgi:hypothetical protein